MSTLTEDDVKLVKNHYHETGLQQAKEEPAAERWTEKKETKEVKKTTETGAAAPASSEGRPVRKKKYVAVYNPQNSQTNLKPPVETSEDRARSNRPGRRQAG